MDTAPRPTATDTDRHPVVVPLRDLDAGDLALAGGKAANLGELIGAGFPVPDGWCVTTDAYAEVAEAAELADLLDDPPADLARRPRGGGGQPARSTRTTSCWTAAPAPCWSVGWAEAGRRA